MKVYSVSEFVTEFNAEYQERVITIRGEVSGFRIVRDRLVYFELKDEESSILCFMIKYQLNVELADGMEVQVTGYPQLFKRTGGFHIRALRIQLFGEGALRRALELLKRKLEQEGLFDETHKRAIPRFPHTIGLITSPDAAAYTDFIRILANRWGGVTVYFAPVGVQGEQAIGEMVGAFRYFNEEHPVDVLVLTRGGGSLEDLQAFNSEKICRAIYGSRIPVVVGVGHERDWTLADFVADRRASTPSNAAEIVVPDRREIASEITYMLSHMEARFGEEITQKLRSIENFVQRFAQNLTFQRERLTTALRRLELGTTRAIGNWRTVLEHQIKLLSTLSPQAVLNRGYSITRLSNHVVKDAARVPVGSTIDTKLSKGQLISTVTEH